MQYIGVENETQLTPITKDLMAAHERFVQGKTAVQLEDDGKFLKGVMAYGAQARERALEAEKNLKELMTALHKQPQQPQPLQPHTNGVEHMMKQALSTLNHHQPVSERFEPPRASAPQQQQPQMAPQTPPPQHTPNKRQRTTPDEDLRVQEMLSRIANGLVDDSSSTESTRRSVGY